MLQICVCVLLQFSLLHSVSQSSDHALDSLKKELREAKDDTNRVVLTFQIGRGLWFRRLIPEAIVMLQKSIEYSEEKHFYTYAADARILLANAFINMEKYDSCFTLLKEAMRIAERYRQEENVPKINHTYCYLYNLLGDHNKALEFGFLAADGYEKNPAPEINIQSVYSWIEIGHVFETQGNYSKARYYFEKALNRAKRSDKDWYLRPALVNLANIYVKERRFNEATSFYNNAINMERSDQGVEYKIWGFSGLGDIAIIQKRYKRAIRYFKDALAIAVDHNMKTNIDNCLCRTGYALLLDTQLDSAEVYLKESLKLAKESGGTATIEDSYKYLSSLSEQQKKYKEALYYAQLYKDISDSSYNETKLTVINNLEILYQTNKREKEIIRLQANNNLKQIELLKRNRLLWITVTTIATLLILLLIYWRITKKNRMIAKQDQMIQQQKISSLEQEQKVVVLKSMLEGQEMERARIAKDLHDGLSGLFSTIKMHLSTVQHENDHLKHNDLFQKSYHMVDTAADDLRHIAHNMMPEVLQKMGLPDALKDFCNSVDAKNSMKVSLLTYGMEERLNLQTEIILYRIVQELLNNVVKHAKASEVIVQLNRNLNHIDITVEDNGSGFIPEDNTTAPHTGLDTIRERVDFLNGKMTIDSIPGVGTTVMIFIDVENKEVA